MRPTGRLENVDHAQRSLALARAPYPARSIKESGAVVAIYFARASLALRARGGDIAGG